jgi:hypothetical protein
MLRKIAIGLAAATFAMGGSALSASTVHGGPGAPSAGKVSGGGGQYGNSTAQYGGAPTGGNISGGSGQYGKGTGGGGQYSGGGPSGGKVSGGGQYGGGPSGGNISGSRGQYGGEGRHVTGDRYRHGHYGYRYYRPHRYSYGGSCWRWTPEGRVWVCGGYGPSYRYGYYRGGGRMPHGTGGQFR